MKHYAILLVAFTIVLATSSKSVAQNTDTSSYKYKLAKTWYYNYSQNFGVMTKPDSTQKQDMIIFRPDMTYEMILNGARTAGIWNISETTHFLTMTDSKTKQSRTVKVVGVIKDQLELKWQAPDLTSEYKYFRTK
jgi:hypothetical protein